MIGNFAFPFCDPPLVAFCAMFIDSRWSKRWFNCVDGALCEIGRGRAFMSRPRHLNDLLVSVTGLGKEATTMPMRMTTGNTWLFDNRFDRLVRNGVVDA